MEPEVHRLDRAELLGDRAVAAERVRQEVEAVVEAAAEKRRAYFEWFIDHMRIEARSEAERRRLWIDMRAAATTPAVNRETSAPTSRQSVSREEVVLGPVPRSWAATG